MAAARTLPGELTCPACQEDFKDPVCLGCGHNFCRACITRCWDWEALSLHFHCPQCRAAFSQRRFQPNSRLREMVEASRQRRLESGEDAEAERVCEKHERPLDVFCQEDQTPICVLCRRSPEHRDHSAVPVEEAAEDYKEDVQYHLVNLKKEREKILSFKLSGENKSQELLKELQLERQKILSEFQQLRQFLEEQERLLLARLEELKKEIEKSLQEYVAKLSEELSSFSSLISESERKCRQPASEFLQDIKGTLDRCERATFQNPAAFSPDLKWRLWESSHRNASLDVVMKKFKDSLVSGQQLNQADVTLDPDTAHPQLVLSEDRRRVKWEPRQEPPPDTPERFDSELCVLGREGFTSGRHYWEVEVERRGIWAVGVARESVSRKGEIGFRPEQGVWAVEGQWDRCRVHIPPVQFIDLPQGRAPHRIRVYLDCEGGRVAIYHAGSEESIFTFPPAPFNGERIRPIFWVGYGVSLWTHPGSSPCAPEPTPLPP